MPIRRYMIRPFSVLPWQVTRMTVHADVSAGSFIPAVAAPGEQTLVGA